MAIALRSGALPAPVIVLEKRSVGPSLGAESIQASLIALVSGFAAVFVFMIVYYRIAGMVANVAISKLSGEDTKEQWFALVNDVSEILKAGGVYLGPPISAGTYQSIMCEEWWPKHELN